MNSLCRTGAPALLLLLMVGCGERPAAPPTSAVETLATSEHESPSEVPAYPNATPVPFHTCQSSGATWCWENPLPALMEVWVGGDDAFAVGFSGQVLHHLDQHWTPQYSGTSATLLGVWGSGGTDVFAVGSGGTIVHYDGNRWSVMQSGTDVLLEGVWGSGPDDVYVVGDSDTLLRYDGRRWRQEVPLLGDLNGVWGTGPDSLFVVGERGRIHHYDGTSWQQQRSGTEERLVDVWGASATDVFAVGTMGTILHYDGNTWSPQPHGVEGRAPYFTGVWGKSSSEVYATSNAGILHYDGETWQDSGSGTRNLLTGISGSGECVVVVGHNATVLRHQDCLGRGEAD